MNNDGTRILDCSGCAALPGGLDPRTRCGMSQSLYDTLVSQTQSTFETLSECQNWPIFKEPCEYVGTTNTCPILSSGTNYCNALDGQQLTRTGTWTQTHTQDVTSEPMPDFEYQVYNKGVFHGFWLKFVPDPGYVGFDAEKVVVIADPDFRLRNLNGGSAQPGDIAQVDLAQLVAKMWEVNITVLPLNDAPTINDDLSNQTVSVTIPATQGWTPALAMGDPDLSAETPGQVAVSYTLTDGNGNPVDALTTTGAIPDLHSAPGSLSFEGDITNVNAYAQAVAFVPPAEGSYSLVVTVDDQGGGGSCLLADPTSLWEIAEFRFDDPSTLESPCHKSVSTTFSITAQ